jgi:serine phosphatase RsbU (regulator of sigma subunit)
MNLLNSLGTLESAGLIQVAKLEPDLEYLFRHSLVQDAAYASLLDSDRKRLHLAVGNAIESLYPDRKRQMAAILGYHFEEAGEDQRALDYFILAGDEALGVYANEEAEIQYRRALQLKCCNGNAIAWLYSGLAESLYRQDRLDESLKSFRDGINVYQSLGDDSGVARLYARMARVKWFAGDRPEGLRLCLEGMELVKEAPDSQGKAMLIHETARAYYFNGQPDKALPLCRRALTLAEQLGAVYLQADALATLGILPGITTEESLQALKMAIELAEAHGLLQVAMRAHINMGSMIRTWEADNEAALYHFQKSAELGRLRGVASEEFLGITSYISCLFTPGRLDDIEAELPHLEEVVRQTSNPESMWVTVKFLQGVLRWSRGDWDESIRLHQECLSAFRQQQNIESLVNMLDELSWSYLEKHRWGELSDLLIVETIIDEALQLAQPGVLSDQIWIYPRMVMLRARQGQLEEAQSWLEKTRKMILERKSAWDARFIAECELEIAMARQDWGAALVQVERLFDWEKDKGFRAATTRSMLYWADIYLHRGDAEDLQAAQALLRDALAELHVMGIGHYPEIARDRLKTIQSRLHTQALDHEQLTRELKKARQVQESLLPENPPDIPGWRISVVFEPAHETSGDFYDFVLMPNGSLGMAIADVTDKGTGAALFMALSRSLWRTFAAEFPTQPELTLAKTNQRILADSHGGLYITFFFGILNTANGEFIYSNAGHNTAFLLRGEDGSMVELVPGGMPLGVMDEATWKSDRVSIRENDTLVLYTDGLTDAQNDNEEFFGLDRLKESIKQVLGVPASQARKTLVNDLHAWVGSAPQFDDTTILVVTRDRASSKTLQE